MADPVKKNYEIIVPEGTKDLTIREGVAIHPKELAVPSGNIKGSLQAPINYLIGKPTLASKPENMHMLIDLEKGRLELNIGDQDPFTKIVVIGELTKFAALSTFKINTDQRWNPQDFMKFIRTVKVFFAEKTEVDQMITSFMKWRAKVETEVVNFNNNSGSSLISLEKKVGEIDLKTKFLLEIPIYKGYKPVRFTVEIGLEPKNSGVDLFLYSDELYEQEILQRNAIMDAEMAKFEKYTFSKVIIS